jgi:hypothetical protein
MSDLIELIDYDTAVGKIVAGGGTATLTFQEWMAFNREELGPVGGDLVVENEARAMGMTLAQLLAVADRTTIFVNATVWGPDAVDVKTCSYEIQDASRQGLTP